MISKFARRALSITTAVALTLIAALAPQAAFAETPGIETPESESTPMVLVGYDEEVAKANGFQVITNSDGSQSSIAVTDEAKAQLQQAEVLRAQAQLKALLRLFRPRVTVVHPGLPGQKSPTTRSRSTRVSWCSSLCTNMTGESTRLG